jgi:hypothetical protein
MEAIQELRSSFSAISPLMILQRTGVIPGMPVVSNPAGFVGKQIRLLAGSDDPAHTLEIEQRTADFFKQWGADASVVWLPADGITGNGHFLQLERNSDDVLKIVVRELRSIAGAAGNSQGS